MLKLLLWTNVIAMAWNFFFGGWMLAQGNGALAAACLTLGVMTAGMTAILWVGTRD